MNNLNYKKITLIMSGFLVIEILSFFCWPHPILSGVIIGILSLAIIILSSYRLEYGFLALLSELFIGSMGHLFFVDLDAGKFPLRIAIWTAFMTVFAVKFIRQLIMGKSLFKRSLESQSYLKSIKDFSGKKQFLILAAFILIALANGFVRGHSLINIFSDFNSWIFFLLIIPAIVIYGDRDEKKIARLKTIFLAGALWISLKTLIFLYIFTHDCAITPDIYTWLRKTLNGEMTPTLAGWPRIFIQGQIYAGFAYFMLFWSALPKLRLKALFSRDNILIISGAALFLSTLIISFSRSFWMGLVAAIFFSLILVWNLFSFKKMVTAGIWLSGSLILSFVIIYAVAAFPYIYRTGNFGASFINRVSDGGESAITSRWTLLPVLMNEIGREPFFGQGYGATVTYKSSDPRVLKNNPDGQYTTYAFEWGYLDLWLKLGLLGLAAYLWILFLLIKNGIIKGIKTNKTLYFSLAAGLVFLVVTNIFTPYLNHPLGIGAIIISSCLIRINRIY